MKRITLLGIIAVFTAVYTFADGHELGVTGTKPVVDGVIGVDEYSYVLTDTGGDMTLYLNRTGDTLTIGISANTSGWIGVGLGEMRMNNATIFIGFVKDGETTFSVEKGQGHRHNSSDQDTAHSYLACASHLLWH